MQVLRSTSTPITRDSYHRDDEMHSRAETQAIAVPIRLDYRLIMPGLELHTTCANYLVLDFYTSSAISDLFISRFIQNEFVANLFGSIESNHPKDKRKRNSNHSGDSNGDLFLVGHFVSISE